MKINKILNGDTLNLEIEGSLNTTTAPELEKELQESLDGIKKLILNFDKLEYLSSAGLRVILIAQKRMDEQGELIIKNVNEIVLEVFEMTGFADILTIE